MKLTIGINALYLIPGQVGGTEIYLRNLLAAMREVGPENRYVLFVGREEAGAETTPGCVVEAAPVNSRVRPARILWEQTGLPVAAARSRLDVMLNPGFTAPVFCPCPMVTVFHDLQHKRHPEYFRWFDLPFWRLLLWASARRSRALIAPSEATAADLRRYYGVPAGRIHVVPHGVDSGFSQVRERRRGRAPDPVLLAVSTLHPHKNLDRLVRVFARFRQARPQFRLVIVGLRGFVADQLQALVASLGLEAAVEITGWIPRERVYEYFTAAHAFIYPSLFEGFGMPVLEALAAGLPAACSDIEPLRSLAAGGCLLFDPSSDAAMLEAIKRLVADEALRRELAERGPATAAPYSWTATAEGTLRVLRAAAQAEACAT